MPIIGCDFHPGLQQVTIFDNQNGGVSGATLRTSRRSGGVLPLAGGRGGAGGWRLADTYPRFKRLLAELGQEL